MNNIVGLLLVSDAGIYLKTNRVGTLPELESPCMIIFQASWCNGECLVLILYFWTSKDKIRPDVLALCYE